MVDELSGITLKTIGIVRSEIKQPVMRDWEEIISEIVIDSNLNDALDGLEEFSHIIVLYWMHQLPAGEFPVEVHPRGKQELLPVGLFATRSQRRPNPVGKTTVRLLKRRDNILSVKGLDAVDGTPVIDIKPYIPGYDSVADARVPSWISKLRATDY